MQTNEKICTTDFMYYSSKIGSSAYNISNDWKNNIVTCIKKYSLEEEAQPNAPDLFDSDLISILIKK